MPPHQTSANAPLVASTLLAKLKSKTMIGWIAVLFAFLAIPWAVISAISSVISTVIAVRSETRAAAEECFSHQVGHHLMVEVMF
jgi:hypothetical protein